jgi:hypothetical protein
MPFSRPFVALTQDAKVSRHQDREGGEGETRRRGDAGMRRDARQAGQTGLYEKMLLLFLITLHALLFRERHSVMQATHWNRQETENDPWHIGIDLANDLVYNAENGGV